MKKKVMFVVSVGMMMGLCACGSSNKNDSASVETKDYVQEQVVESVTTEDIEIVTTETTEKKDEKKEEKKEEKKKDEKKTTEKKDDKKTTETVVGSTPSTEAATTNPATPSTATTNPATTNTETISTETNNPDSCVGSWHDTIAGRAKMTITQKGDKYIFNILWSDSASTCYEYKFSGKENEGGVIVYSGGTKSLIEYDEKGKETKTILSKKEHGTIEYLADGSLIWTENEAQGAVYEFVRD